MKNLLSIMDCAIYLPRRDKRIRLTSPIRSLLRIGACWKLRDEDTRALLGGILSSFYALKNRAAKNLDTDQLTRVPLLIGIYKALNILYTQSWQTRG